MHSSAFVTGQQLHVHRSPVRTTRRSICTPQALFKRKAPEPVVEEAPAMKGLFGLGPSKASSKPASPARSKKEAELLAELERRNKKPNFFSQARDALDFSEVRSKNDAELLYQARYGKQDKMTPEQYKALRRKIGGTAKDYWKSWVDVKGEYADKGYVSTEETNVVALPFLIAVVVALFGAAGYVVVQTGGGV